MVEGRLGLKNGGRSRGTKQCSPRKKPVPARHFTPKKEVSVPEAGESERKKPADQRKGTHASCPAPKKKGGVPGLVLEDGTKIR